ncbi:MAG: hypothetical protein M3405_09800 [Acidobacteriota bacterium]|nr:hypothetical protein [Acidobacteriota bacterium]
MKIAILTIICVFLTGFFINEPSKEKKDSLQDKLYPNEIKGFEFFGEGKLKDLKLGSSKSKDVELIFGESCEESCDYDENFKLKIEYLKAFDDCMTTEDIRDRAMCPLNDFVGTISAIKLTPKQDHSLVIPTSDFNIVTGGITSEKGSNGNSISWTSFTDKYGLRYSLNNESSGKVTIYSHYPSFMEGKLHSIEYNFTDDIIRKIFTVEYMTRKKELNK